MDSPAFRVGNWKTMTIDRPPDGVPVAVPARSISAPAVPNAVPPSAAPLVFAMGRSARSP